MAALSLCVFSSFVFITVWCSVQGARILCVIPTPMYSHQIVFRPVTAELARRGHQVVVITTDPAYPPEATPYNLTEIDVRNISYETWTQNLVNLATGNQNDLYAQMYTAYSLTAKTFPRQMLNEEIQNLLRNKKKNFDLLIAEAWVRPILALAHLLDVPVVQIATLGGNDEQYEALGVPRHPFLFGDYLRVRVFNHTLWEKIVHVYDYFWMRYLTKSHKNIEDEMITHIFGSEMPIIEQLRRRVVRNMVNVDALWEGPSPMTPQVVHLGGLHLHSPQSLLKDLQQYMDESVRGVIYVSFGTNASPSLLPPGCLELIIRALGRLPYNVLFKIDSAAVPNCPANIRMASWFPQNDLLHHPNLKLFVTQAGLQSTDEALAAGVPLLAMPMLGDQFYNAEQYVRLGVGKMIRLNALTEDGLVDTIQELITDPSFRASSNGVGRLMRDHPHTSLERAVWWIEYALRHAADPYMRAPGAGVSWPEYLELNLVACVLVILITTSMIVFISLRYLIRAISKTTQNKTK